MALTDARSTFVESFLAGVNSNENHMAVAAAAGNIRYDDVPVLKRSAITANGLGSIDAWNGTADPDSHSMDSPYSTTGTYAEYSSTVKISKLSAADQKGLIAQAGEALGFSTSYTLANLLMSKVTAGFTDDTYSAGIAVYSDSHVVRGGGTFNNRIASALDRTSFSTALATMRQWVSYEGHTVDAAAAGGAGLILLVPPELETTARELIESDLSGSGNQRNTLKDMGVQVTVSSQITDSDSWQLINAKHKPCTLWVRSAPEFDMFTDQYTHSTVLRVSFAAVGMYEPQPDFAVGSIPA